MSNWLGFEDLEVDVTNQTRLIREGRIAGFEEWSEDECRRRSGYDQPYLIPVFGAGGVYDQDSSWEEETEETTPFVSFGETILEEGKDECQQ